MKSTVDNPREYDASMKGWEVDLARDDQANCRGCDAAIYFIYIKTKAGAVKRHPISEADMIRRPCPNCTGDLIDPRTRDVWKCRRCNDSHVVVYGISHFSNCPARERYGGTPIKKQT